MTVTSSPKTAGGVAWGAGAVVLLALLLPPLVAHGCHGDEVDHEPVAVPFPPPQAGEGNQRPPCATPPP